MANHASALKRARQNEVRRLRNKSVKTKVKNATKMVTGSSAEEVDAEETAKRLDAAKSVIDKAAKTGVIHKKTAARKISRLSRFVNAQNG